MTAKFECAPGGAIRPALPILFRLKAIGAATAGCTLLYYQSIENLERWALHEFTEVAANLSIIKKGTHTETKLAREFRNLIHPGRAQRLGQTCDRGTAALASVAALDHVVRDLS
jgi:hypothetical protein